MKLEEPVVIVKNSRKPFKSGKYVETSDEIEHHRSYNYRLSPTRNYELKVTCWLFSDMEFVDRKNLAVRRNKYPFRKYD